MIKTLTIGGVETRLSNNIGWVLAYRDQFGRDILPALMPAIWSIFDLAGKVLGAAHGGKITAQDAADLLQDGALDEALIKLSGLEVADLINIVWALAKAADDTIPEPKRWVRQFEEFPLDEIAPAVFELVAAGVMTSKNRERLQTALSQLRPENLQK